MYSPFKIVQPAFELQGTAEWMACNVTRTFCGVYVLFGKKTVNFEASNSYRKSFNRSNERQCKGLTGGLSVWSLPGRSMVETISGCSSVSIMQRWKVLLMDDCRKLGREKGRKGEGAASEGANFGAVKFLNSVKTL